MGKANGSRRASGVAGAPLLIAVSIVVGGASAHGGPRWIESLYSTEKAGAFTICQSKGGGCAVAGYARITDSGDHAFIAQLKSAGTISWQKEIDTGNPYYYDPFYAVSLKQTKDGGYVALGHGDRPNDYSYDIWLLKLDSKGKVTGQERFGGAGENYAGEVQQTTDGGFVVCATTDYFDKYYYDMWVVKLDSTGTITWQKRYTQSKRSGGATSIQQTADGGYIVGGRLRNNANHSTDVFVMKLDSTGTVTWQSRIGGTKKYQYAELNCIREAKDGGFIAVGTTPSYGSGKTDAWVLKFDSAGAVLWQKAIGGSNKDEGRYVEVQKDGTYVIAGKFVAPQQQPDGWLFKLDTAGNILWQKATGGPSGEAFSAVQTALDGGFFAAGYSQSFGPGEPNVFVVRYDKNGKISDSCTYNNDSAAVAVSSTAVAVNPGLVAVDTYVRPTVTTVVSNDTTATVSAQCTGTGSAE